MSGKSIWTKVLQEVKFNNPSIKAGVTQTYVLIGLQPDNLLFLSIIYQKNLFEKQRHFIHFLWN